MSDNPAAAMAITGRAMSPEDEPFLFALYESARADELAAWGWNRVQQEQFLGLQFAAQQRHFQTAYPALEERIVQMEGRAVGRVCVARNEFEIRLVDITLIESLRGRGIGAGLIRELQNEAAAAGKPLRLSVLPSSPALRLYQRLGFVACGGDGICRSMEWRATSGAPHAGTQENRAMRCA